MRILFFCENKYALDILYPLYQEAIKQRYEVLWYIHAPKITKFDWENDVHWTSSIQACYDYRPAAIFVPGNIVPYYLPGVKIQVFHGYAAEKKDHWIIRHYFDLYFTQGPYFTSKFKQLASRHKNFDVFETGWTKQDWIKSHLHNYDELKKEYLEKAQCKEIILYAPTFSPKLTSLPIIRRALLDTLEQRSKTLLLIKLHPLTKQKWIDEYKQLAAKHKRIFFIEDSNVTPYQLISDIMISDTSSTVYEFLLLDKPVITLGTIAKDIYWTNITDSSQLPQAIEYSIHDSQAIQRRQWIVNNYDPHLDGFCCKRMLETVNKYIEQHGIPSERYLNLWRRYTSIKKFGKIKIK